MKCPKCDAENADARKFCRECGEKFLLTCPQCNTENIPGDKFCGECGHNLTLPSEQSPKDLSFDDKLDKIQRYLPTGLTEKILAQKDKIEGERKQVTVMFCDLEGFTSLSEKLGPEKMYDIMDQVYEILIHKVQDYEGTVNEMTGDGIMALFGAPIALEDAPQRAIRAGMAIHREMTKFIDKHKDENIPVLKMRIGIHTGPVVVGTLGNDLRVEFKAVGDTVNLASRMEGLAEPGTTYVTEDTFKLTEGLFRFEALGKKAIKGKKDKVRSFRVIATSSRRTRFDVSAERGLTPFIGKERELEILLDGFEMSKSGRGRAFSIVAEAGVGKSRLLYEFRKAVSNEDVTFLEGKCLSYGRNMAYHPIIDILKSTFNIGDDDNDKEIKQKVINSLSIFGVDEASTLPYFLELMSVSDSGIDQIAMSPEGKKAQIIEALKRIILKGSEIRHLIMVIEDLHWIDKSSEDALKDLLLSVPGARILLIFTYRTEYSSPWSGKSYHSQINLNRLSNDESLAMVSHILDTEVIDRDIEKLVFEKTEGIPFFIEEFVKSLKELKIIEEEKKKYHLAKNIRNITIPSTVQDVIMARVDTLPEGVKELLQAGSAIEREFGYKLIKKVTALSEKELLTYLSVLKDSELLYERGIYQEATYIFKHALTQEVTYDSILTKRKKKLHEDIGSAIEELYKENIDEYYGILAEHFIKSENYEKGAAYSKLASKKALKASGPYDAIEFAKKRIFCLEALPQTNEVQIEIIDARASLGMFFIEINYHMEAKEAVDPIIDMAIKYKYKRRLSQIYIILGTFNYMVEEDYPKAFKRLEEVIEISNEIEDVVLNTIASYWLGLALSFDCQFNKALYHLEKVFNINMAVKDLWGIIALKSVLSYFVYHFHGRIDLSYQTSSDAIQISQESVDIYVKAMANISHGVSSHCKGLLKEAKEHLLMGIEICKKMNIFGWQSMAEFYLGETYFEIGEYNKAIDHYEEAVRVINQSRIILSWMNFNKICVARAKVMNKEKNVDLELLYGYVSKNKVTYYNGWSPRYISDILLNIDDQHISEAEEWIKKAIEADKQSGMMFHLGRDYALYAELFIRKNDIPNARENLDKAIEIYKECGSDGWAEKAETKLTAL